MRLPSRRVVGCGLALLGVLSCLAVAAAGKPAESAAPVAKSRLEQMAERMIPQQRLDEAAGFFGPVVKKYQPVLLSFQQEYRAAKDKRAVALKYMPQVDAALADARKMRVPVKYEAKKAEYIQMFEAFVLAAKFYVQFGR